MKALAVIPARGGSKRIPGKNIRPFCGTPLISWTIRFAQSCGMFDRIVVSTDSKDIADIASAEGIEISWLRPAEISGDTAGSVDVALHALGEESRAGRTYQLVALLQPTSPVRYTERWAEAVEMLGSGLHDAAIGLAPASSHPYHSFRRAEAGTVVPFVDLPYEKRQLRHQDLPPAYAIAGNLYLIKTAVLTAERTFFPPRTAGVICDRPCEALDIDTVSDWVASEALVNYFGSEPCRPL